MSEVVNESTPEELVENFDYELDDSEVIPMPIDPTLTHAGEAADAKATGDAIANITGKIKVNGKTVTNNEVTLYAPDIKVSDQEGAQTIMQVMDSIEGREGKDIVFDSTINQKTIATVFNEFAEAVQGAIPDETIDEIVEDVFEGE